MVNSMFILNACNDGDVLRTVRIFLIFLNVLKNLVAVIIIIMGIIDFSKVVTDGKSESMNEAGKTFFKRIIAGFIVFFLPTIINGFLSAVGTEAVKYQECINNATEEGIANAYYNKAKELINNARSSLEMADYSDAHVYLVNVKDSAKRKQLETELKKVKAAVDLKIKITAMNKKEQYIKLREEVNKIDDNGAQSNLSGYLDDQYRSVNVEGKANIDLGGEQFIKEETDTLKVYINKVNSYYITQIWVKDPYTQLNKFDSPEYGRSLYRPGALLSRAVANNGLGNKLVVGFNASGFYLKDTYDAASVNYYPAYNKTSVGSLVITNGNVVRNAYDKAYKTWFIAGVDRTGNFKIYTDEKSNNISSKKAWSENVIGSIRNTFTFASPLVMNGQASNITMSMPSPGSALKRQAMCQVDSNNFILITGSNLSRQDLINIMLKSKCKIGTNFDGGGSIALLFKGKNSNQINAIIGNGRALSEVGYFSE